MYIPTYYFGNLPIEMWEFPTLLLLLAIVFFISIYLQKRNYHRPEYTFFLWGLWAKIFGGIAFGFIYIFYYQGGDTIGYFSSALAYCNLLLDNPEAFMTAYFGPVSPETISLFSAKTGEPLGYMFYNDQTRIVIKLLVPFLLIGAKSYFVTTALVAIFTYGGIWRLYKVFCTVFPQHYKILAVSILFMPSVLFWGSGILKDSFTLAATCYFLSAIHDIVSRNKSLLRSALLLLASSFLIISIKPYIFLILLPGALIWLFHARILKVRNGLIRFSVIPFTYLFIFFGSYAILYLLGDRFGKYSINNALATAVISQQDLKQDYYEGNAFDIGDFEATPRGVISKFPQATVAGFFRPYIWESKKVVMFFSGLENLFILSILTYILIMGKWKRIVQSITSSPILLCSIVFAVLFAFMIGISTSNFGALVRFKIPLIPLFMSCLMILASEINSGKKNPNHEALQ